MKDDIASEIYPDGIEGFADEQERCDAAEEAAFRLLGERDELRTKLLAAEQRITWLTEEIDKLRWNERLRAADN